MGMTGGHSNESKGDFLSIRDDRSVAMEDSTVNTLIDELTRRAKCD